MSLRRPTVPERTGISPPLEARLPSTDGLILPAYRDGIFWLYLIIVALVFIWYMFIMNSSTKTLWYQNLQKPGTRPNPILISILWAIIYILLAYSTYIGHRYARSQNEQVLVNVAFALNLILAVAWAWVFYKQRNPKVAFWILVLLFIETLWMAWLISRINRSAGVLFIIYAVWLAVMGWYNWQIVSLNGL